MQINATEKQNFKGFYTLTNKGNNLKHLQEAIVPMYKAVRKEPIYFFVGKNPYNIGLKQALGDAMKHSGYGEEWVRANAKNHGIDLSVFGEDNIYIISGKKDFQSFVEFAQRKRKEIFSIWHKFSTIFRMTKRYFSQKGIPNYLKYLDYSAEQNKIENQQFSNFINGRAINFDNPYKLVEHMMKN